jgi:2-aminobenzoate-CoA ligase
MTQQTSHIDTFVRDRLPPPEQQPEFLFDLPELQYPARLNAAVELMKNDPSGVSFINDHGRWSYGEMDDISSRIARVLAEEEGLVPGNRVFLRGPNGAMLFACWLGILKAGGVVVGTMPILRAGEVATILDRAQVSHAIVDDRCLDDYQPGAAQAGTVRSLLTYHGDLGGGALEARLEGVAPGFRAVNTLRDDVALIAFTSGTTGKPKGCVHYHRDVLASADSFARNVLEPEPGQRWACSAPLAFTFGLGMQFVFPFRFGGTAVTVGAPGPGPLLEAIARHRVNVVATAPTAYKAMIGMVGDYDISSLATCVSAGEHLPAATWRAWNEATGLMIIDGIGATEMMHIFISASGDDIRPGATGRAVPGYEATVLDDRGRPMAEGTGRLAIKGPTGCRYFDDERQKKYVVDGWNVTGDTYRKDEEGYYWYIARSDDMIISAGYNIAAPEVENALYSHPSVAECAVVGVPCEERGQKVKAFVVASEPVEVAELQEHVKRAIAPYKYPRDVQFVDALPKTATGKLQRFALRESR